MIEGHGQKPAPPPRPSSTSLTRRIYLGYRQPRSIQVRGDL